MSFVKFTKQLFRASYRKQLALNRDVLGSNLSAYSDNIDSGIDRQVKFLVVLTCKWNITFLNFRSGNDFS